MKRRDFLKLAGVVASATTLSKLAHAQSSIVKLEELKKNAPLAAVYHCDFNNQDRFNFMLTNIKNHLSIYNFDASKINIAVVCNGEGVRFMMNDLTGTPWEKENIKIEENLKKLKELSDHKVNFYVCAITVEKNKLDTKKLHEFVKLVPSGVGTVTYLQSIGYAYIKVG